MGCDAHVHIEVKINGTWHHYNHPRIGRDYRLFAKLGGVRLADVEEDTPDEAWWERGLPDDITEISRFCWKNDEDGKYAHGATWLTGAEIEKVGRWYEELRLRDQGGFYSFSHHTIGYLFGNGFDVKQYPDDYPEGVEDARVLIWFDN